jgi:hypothetical protein
VVHAVSLIWLVIALPAALATELPACDPVWLPIARPPGVRSFVAIARTDTVLDEGAVGTRRSRGGQRVRILGKDRESREAVVVPWAYGPDCRRVPWSEGLAWIPPGTRGVITGYLRPREQWLDRLPTYDVEMAWREPVWTREDPRWARGDERGPLLSPEEFLELYGALPLVPDLERAPAEAAARVRAWERRHPSIAGRPPGRAMLDNLYRAAESSERSR